MLARLLELLAVISPVVLLLGCGHALARIGILDPAGRRSASKLVYWVLLPALLIAKLGETDPRALFSGGVWLAGASTFIVGLGLAVLATRRLRPPERAAVASSVCRFNGMFVGLPVIVMLAERLPAPGNELLVPMYLVVLASLVPVSHVCGLLAIVGALHGFRAIRRVALELARNPILISAAIGMSLGLTAPGLSTAGWFGRSLNLLGSAAVPLALLTTGAALDLALIRRRPALLTLTCATRLLALPILAAGLCVLLGVDELQTLAVVIMCGCPTAISAVPIARELGADEHLTAACVVATTVCAPVSLLAWLLVLT